jgi:hypothetical protein
MDCVVCEAIALFAVDEALTAEASLHCSLTGSQLEQSEDTRGQLTGGPQLQTPYGARIVNLLLLDTPGVRDQCPDQRMLQLSG